MRKTYTLRFNGRFVKAELKYVALYEDYIIKVFKTENYKTPVIGVAIYRPTDVYTWAYGETVREVRICLEEWAELPMCQA